jgi:hypothetical protein
MQYIQFHKCSKYAKFDKEILQENLLNRAARINLFNGFMYLCKGGQLKPEKITFLIDSMKEFNGISAVSAMVSSMEFFNKLKHNTQKVLFDNQTIWINSVDEPISEVILSAILKLDSEIKQNYSEQEMAKFAGRLKKILEENQKLQCKK